MRRHEAAESRFRFWRFSSESIRDSLRTRWGFRDVIARKAMDIVQPDLCAAGSFPECRKIATLASAFGVECVPLKKYRVA